MDRELKLVVTFNDQGGVVGLRTLNAELGATDRAGQQTKTGFQGMMGSLSNVTRAIGTMTGALGIAGVALKKTYDQIRSGAELELTISRFDRLAESIGTTADALLHDLNQATGGMMSNAAQMESASSLISLGLAKNQGDVVRLATLISELGWDMNQVILTFTNNSIRRLDALGLSVEDVTTRAKELEAQGINMDKAFDLAVIEAGEAKLKLLGSAADTDLGSFKRLEAAFGDTANKARLALAPGVATAADALALLLTWSDKVDNALAEQKDRLSAVGVSYEDYVRGVLAAEVAAGRLSEVSAEETARLILSGDAAEQVYKAHGLLTEAERTQEQQVKALDAAYEAAGVTLNAYNDETWRGTDASISYADATALLNDTLSSSRSEFEEMLDVYGDLNRATDTGLLSVEAIKQGLDDLAITMQGEVGAEYDSFIERNDDLTEKVGELRGKISELSSQHYLTSAQQEELNSLQTELDETNQAIFDNATAHEDATKRILFSLLQQRAAIDGVSSGEFALLTNMAEQWGLIDEATANAMLGIDQALTDLAGGESLVEVSNQINDIKNEMLGNADVAGTEYLQALDAVKNALDRGKLSAAQASEIIAELKDAMITGQPVTDTYAGMIWEFGAAFMDAKTNVSGTLSSLQNLLTFLENNPQLLNVVGQQTIVRVINEDTGPGGTRPPDTGGGSGSGGGGGEGFGTTHPGAGLVAEGFPVQPFPGALGGPRPNRFSPPGLPGGAVPFSGFTPNDFISMVFGPLARAGATDIANLPGVPSPAIPHFGLQAEERRPIEIHIHPQPEQDEYAIAREVARVLREQNR